MGPERLKAFAAHPKFIERVGAKDWQQREEHQADEVARATALRARAREAYDRVLSGADCTEDNDAW